MSKMTKRRRDKILNQVRQAKEIVQGIVDALVALEDYENLNALHDCEWNLEQYSREVNHEYTTRNWLPSDWYHWNLVANNID